MSRWRRHRPTRTGRVIGIDLGGTKIAGGLVSPDGAIAAVRTSATPAAHGAAAVLDAVAAVVRELADVADGPEYVRAIGIGTAGVVDVRSARIVSATDVLPGWTGVAVADELRSRLPGATGVLPVHVQNDVDAHAAGEAWLGAAAGLGCVLVVAVGTGVGGAVVLDGVPVRGAHHVAGEIGHLPTPGAEGLRCTCGRTGHLEALGSGPSLYRRYRALGGASECRDARDVVARARDGDVTAARAIEDAATAVGRAIAAVVTVLDPDAVVLAGGLPGAGEVWWRPMETALRAELIDPLVDLPVLPAALGPEAAMIGAARAAWELWQEEDGKEQEEAT